MKTFTPQGILVPGKPRKVRAGEKGKPAKKNPRPRKALAGPDGKEIVRNWLLVDAKDKILGRLATQVANLLRGKHKTLFVPHQDVGDFVVVVNAGEIKLSGNKATEKMYYRHSGYPGGLRNDSYGSLREKTPDLMVWVAVKRMLPRNKLRARFLRKLKVYSGSEHPHIAQQPKPVELTA